MKLQQRNWAPALFFNNNLSACRGFVHSFCYTLREKLLSTTVERKRSTQPQRRCWPWKALYLTQDLDVWSVTALSLGAQASESDLSSTAPDHRNYFICEAVTPAPEVASSFCLSPCWFLLVISCEPYIPPGSSRPSSPSPNLPRRGPDLPLRTDIFFFLKHLPTSLVGWIIIFGACFCSLIS